MLKRMYVDNFRCLVNFDLNLDRLNLLLGDNGGGKTSVFEVLRRLQEFLAGDVNVDKAFPAQDITRWQRLDIQRFELDLKADKDVYSYTLSIEHDPERRRRRMKSESLHMNQKPLFKFETAAAAGTAHLYHDDFTAGPEVLFDWSRSGVASLQERPDNQMLTRFRKMISKLVIVSPCPVKMVAESREEDCYLAPKADNFASWYRFLSQEHQGNIVDLTQELRKVLTGFDSFRLREAGENARVLKVLFHAAAHARVPSDGKFNEMNSETRSLSGSSSTSSSSSPSSSLARYENQYEYNFDELSDGQRQLVFLYCLLYGVKGEGYSLFVDEPDNYVALREIQPWLTSLQDSCGDSVEQAVLISHHPEIIDYLARSAGRWFDRPENGPTRILDKPPAAVDGLKTSEAIARGLNS